MRPGWRAGQLPAAGRWQLHCPHYFSLAVCVTTQQGTALWALAKGRRSHGGRSSSGAVGSRAAARGQRGAASTSEPQSRDRTHGSLHHGRWGDAREEAGLSGGVTCPPLSNIPVEGPLSSSHLYGGGEADSPVPQLVSGPQLVLSPSSLHSPVHNLLAVTSAVLRGLPVRVITVPGGP